MTGAPRPATVLVVDDERAYVDAYANWLEDDYDVRTATSGEAALAEIDESVDVVLLDRRMPDLSGDEVLAELRDRGLDVRVGMITAVEPTVDIVDMAFDEYLVKPVSERDLRETVEALLVRSSLNGHIQECFSLVSKKTALEVSMDRSELEAREEYRRLESRIGDIERQVESSLTELIERNAVYGAYVDIES